MSTTTEAKIVNWRLEDRAPMSWGRRAQAERTEFTVVRCANSHKCQAYAMGKCCTMSMWKGRCPHAVFQNEKGWTKQALKYQSWRDERYQRVKGIERREPPTHICQTGDFIYFPYPDWYKDGHVPSVRRDGTIKGDQEYFIPLDQFTLAFFNQVVNASPRDYGGVPCKDWEITKNKILADCQEYLPGFYQQWQNEFPAAAEQHADINYVGLKAYVDSLNPCEWTDGKVRMAWDGTTVTVTGWSTYSQPITGVIESLRITPDEKATMTITDNSQVGEQTRFA